MINFLSKSIYIVFACVCLLVSCDKDYYTNTQQSTQQTAKTPVLNLDQPFENNLFHLSESGERTRLTEAALVKQWKAADHLTADQKIVDIHLATDVVEATGKEVLMLRGKRADGTTSYGVAVEYDPSTTAFLVKDCICACAVQPEAGCGGSCDPIANGNQCYCNSCHVSFCSAFRLCNHP